MISDTLASHRNPDTIRMFAWYNGSFWLRLMFATFHEMVLSKEYVITDGDFFYYFAQYPVADIAFL